MKNVFVDSNIWIYAFSSNDAAKQLQAKKILKAADQEIVISAQVVGEVSVNLIKKSQMLPEELLRITEQFYEKYRVEKPDLSMFRKAIDLRKEFRLSFWDSLVIAAAIISNCEIVLSEDMQDGQKIDTIIIKNPFLLKVE